MLSVASFFGFPIFPCGPSKGRAAKVQLTGAVRVKAHLLPSGCKVFWRRTWFPLAT